MAILDGLPKTKAETERTLAIATKVFESGLAKAKLTSGQRRVLDLMKKGLSMADIAGISKEERDACLALGCRQLQVGDLVNAEATLLGLVQIEPSDERAIYALAATYQAQRKYEVAGRLYLQFLALDATNPQGYLRLGECFMGAREPEGARGCFEAAKVLNNKGRKDPSVAVLADQMLALLPVTAAA